MRASCGPPIATILNQPIVRPTTMPFGRGGQNSAPASARLSSRKKARINGDQFSTGDRHSSPASERPLLSERGSMGEILHTQEHVRSYVAGCYLWRFNEPAVDDWQDHVQTLANETKSHPRTIRAIWQTVRDANSLDAATAKPGSTGRPSKLSADNRGLIAGTVDSLPAP
jgi:hypothetical protein